MTAPSTYPWPGAAPDRMPATRRGLAAIAVAAALAYAVLLPPFSIGQGVESRFFPIFAGQSVPGETVTREGRTLCWTWTREKRRAPPLLDLDVSLDTADGDSYAPEIYDAVTGVPWHRGGALPPGRYTTRFCTSIPAAIPAEIPVRLRQTVSFRGFAGLWTIRAALPVIIAR